MRTIKWILETGFSGVHHAGMFKVEDNTLDEEIEELAKQEAFDCIDWSWWEE